MYNLCNEMACLNLTICAQFSLLMVFAMFWDQGWIAETHLHSAPGFFAIGQAFMPQKGRVKAWRRAQN